MRNLAAIFLLLLVAAVPAVAQQQYGTVSGTVVDNAGAILPGVTVVLSGPYMQGTRTAVSDTNGRFRFSPVPPGEGYMIKFELSGFNTIEQTGLVVNIGKDTAIQAEMSLSQFAETLTVTSDRLVVDTSKTTVDTTVTWDLIDSLATNRNFQTIMALAPGVRGANNPYVNGGANDANIYLIDGVDTTDPRVGTWGSTINWDSIQEGQLQTGGFNAEFGRATAGILNLVTKSGGNEYAFTGRYVIAKPDWSANNGIDSETGNPKVGGTRNDEKRPSITLSGPILKDALWFFGSYEKRDNSRGYNWFATLADYQAGIQQEGRTSYAGRYLSGKLTWQAGPSHSFRLYYTEDPIELRPVQRGWNEGVGGVHYNTSVDTFQFQGGNNSSFTWTGVLNPNFFMEGKFQRTRQELSNRPDEPGFGEVPYINDTTFNYRYGGAQRDYQSLRNRDGFSLAGSYFLDSAKGAHQLKAGVEYMKIDPKAGQINNPAGYYRVRNGAPFYYQIWLDQTGLKESKQDYYALFVQDQWKLGNLTLNLGLRAESTEIFNNQGASLVKFGYGKEIAPRLGFAYDLNGDSIHGFIGRFYTLASNYIADYFAVTTDHVQRWNWNNSCTADARDVWTYNQSCWTMQYDLPTGAGGHTLDPNLKPGAIDEFNIGYDKRLTDRLAVGAQFIWRQQKTAIDWYDPEASGYYYITNVPGAARDWPDTGQAIADKKFLEFQSIQFSAIKRLGPEGLQVVANYTYNIKHRAWAQNWRNTGAFVFTSPEAMNPLWYGSNEFKHDLKLNFTYNTPWTTIVGLNLYWNSGAPYTPITYEGAEYTAIPLAQRGSKTVGSDYDGTLYIEQPLKLGPITASVYANMFNLLNTQRPLTRQGNHDLATYTNALTWQNPRRLELGFKIEY